MSIKLLFNKSNQINDEKSLSNEKLTSVNLQYIPAKISNTTSGGGDASHNDELISINKFFTNYTTNTATIDGNEQTILFNSLRGYPMKGITDFNVPNNYCGFIFCEPNKPALSTELVNRELNEKYQFQKFTYWNYDKFPSANDSLKKAMDWIDVAKAIYNPIQAEEIENFSFEQHEITDNKKEKQEN